MYVSMFAPEIFLHVLQSEAKPFLPPSPLPPSPMWGGTGLFAPELFPHVLQSEAKQRAEVEVYFKRFEEAEKLYMEMDRRSVVH